MLMNKQTIAAIDIGSSSIRFTIAEIIDKEINILEDLRQSIKLGKDSFYKGKISRSTINECIIIMKNFKKLCDEYRVNRIKAAATTALREASNSDIFIDNISTYTGIDISILSNMRETEYIYKALSKFLDDNKGLKIADDCNGIIEVGAGSIEITLFRNDIIIFSSSLPIGALKIKQIYGRYPANGRNIVEFIKATIENELRALKKEFRILKINTVFGIGSEIEELSRIFKIKKDRMTERIGSRDLEKFCNRIAGYSEEEQVHDLDIPHDLSGTFLPVVVLFNEIVKFFKCDSIIIPPISLRDGLIDDMVIRENSKKYHLKLENQVRENSLNIGRSLNFDEKHALKILEFALIIFDETYEIHNMGLMERCYMTAAAILHDIGMSISNRSHHKHSLYIINAQEFYYLDDNDRNIIANIARYHRRSVPKVTHADYMKLGHKDRMTVMKLASILRIADSLDNTDLQHIESIKVRTENGVIMINAKTKDNIFAEIYSFNFKKELFEEFFGIKVELKISGTKNG
jgi:exopolyphosphatase / guanosine-5'-triphosphate,3'-diphosphate pyrophosphatase